MYRITLGKGNILIGIGIENPTICLEVTNTVSKIGAKKSGIRPVNTSDIVIEFLNIEAIDSFSIQLKLLKKRIKEGQFL